MRDLGFDRQTSLPDVLCPSQRQQLRPYTAVRTQERERRRRAAHAGTKQRLACRTLVRAAPAEAAAVLPDQKEEGYDVYVNEPQPLEEGQEKHLLSVFVADESGIINRVAGVFARRGANIDSLAVGLNIDKALFTIVVTGTANTISKLMDQLAKLVKVRYVENLTNATRVERELVLIKVKAPPGPARTEVMQLLDIFRARCVDVSERSLTICAAGDAGKTLAMQRVLNKFGILQIARTGKISLKRGDQLLEMGGWGDGQRNVKPRSQGFTESQEDPLPADSDGADVYAVERNQKGVWEVDNVLEATYDSGGSEYEPHTISIEVKDEPGVLNMVSAVFARRGYNVQSLAVGNSEREGMSRIITVIPGNRDGTSKIIKQLYKLASVEQVTDLSDVPFVSRELMLIKVRCDASQRRELVDLAEIFHGNICDVSLTTTTLELQGKEDKMQAIQTLLAPYGILEVARTGRVALARDSGINTKYLDRMKSFSTLSDQVSNKKVTQQEHATLTTPQAPTLGALYITQKLLRSVILTAEGEHWPEHKVLPTDLPTLDLSFKSISHISNLAGICGLRELRLENNKITEIRGLDSLTRLTLLDLAFNNLTRIEELSRLAKLATLSLFCNKIAKLEGLHQLVELSVLSLGQNKLSELADLASLSALPKLLALNLDGNPLTVGQNHRSYVVAHLPNLQKLDMRRITDAERELAKEKHQLSDIAVRQSAATVAEAHEADVRQESKAGSWLQIVDGLVQDLLQKLSDAYASSAEPSDSQAANIFRQKLLRMTADFKTVMSRHVHMRATDVTAWRQRIHDKIAEPLDLSRRQAAHFVKLLDQSKGLTEKRVYEETWEGLHSNATPGTFLKALEPILVAREMEVHQELQAKLPDLESSQSSIAAGVATSIDQYLATVRELVDGIKLMNISEEAVPSNRLAEHVRAACRRLTAKAVAEQASFVQERHATALEEIVQLSLRYQSQL